MVLWYIIENQTKAFSLIPFLSDDIIKNIFCMSFEHIKWCPQSVRIIFKGRHGIKTLNVCLWKNKTSWFVVVYLKIEWNLSFYHDFWPEYILRSCYFWEPLDFNSHIFYAFCSNSSHVIYLWSPECLFWGVYRSVNSVF
jgi:hypothetical protein